MPAQAAIMRGLTNSLSVPTQQQVARRTPSEVA
jgi:hypothetical protein